MSDQKLTDEMLAGQIRLRFDQLLAEKAAITTRLPLLDAQLRDCAAGGRLFGVHLTPPPSVAATSNRKTTVHLHLNSRTAETLTVLRQVAPAGLTYKQLADKTGIAANNVSARLTYLKDKGLVRRESGVWFSVS